MAERERFFYLDNLKVGLTMLLIAHHVGQAYGPTGGSWPIQEAARAAILGPFFTVNRSFFMSLFFLISGYLVARSYDAKPGWPFVKGRLLRLGLPILAFALLMIPLQLFVFPAPGTSEPGTVWPLDVGTFWFLQHLLLFSLGYAAWRTLLGRRDAERHDCPLRAWQVAVFATLLAPILGLIRIPFPIDRWDHLLGFFRVMFADLPRDLAFFVLGVVAFRRKWFETVSPRAGCAWLGVGAALAAFWYAFALGLYRVIPLQGTTFDIFRVAWETFLCTALCIGLVVLFRQRVTAHGKLAQALGRAQYAAYLFHVPVILAIQSAALGVPWQPFAKFAVVTALSVPATFAVAHAARKPLCL